MAGLSPRQRTVLRIAGAPCETANGTPLSPQRLQPDIAVTVDAADERLFDDPYRERRHPPKWRRHEPGDPPPGPMKQICPRAP